MVYLDVVKSISKELDIIGLNVNVPKVGELVVLNIMLLKLMLKIFYHQANIYAM